MFTGFGGLSICSPNYSDITVLKALISICHKFYYFVIKAPLERQLVAMTVLSGVDAAAIRTVITLDPPTDMRTAITIPDSKFLTTPVTSSEWEEGSQWLKTSSRTSH